MKPGLSVVMPTYQRASHLLLVLTPLLRDPSVDEVVVVVDGSTDGSLELLHELAAGDHRVRPLWQENAGAGAARQRAIDIARHEVVLLLDDDVLAGPGLPSGHAAEHRRKPGRVILGHMPTRVPVRRRPGDVTTIRYATDYEHACREYLAHPDRILEHLWSGHLSMPRSLAIEVGWGDPDLVDLFPSEDLALGLRLRDTGVEAAFCPELTATHLHRTSVARFARDSRRQGAAQVVLHRRHPDVVARPTGRQLAGRLPLPARWLVLAAARDRRVGAAAQAALVVLVALLGQLRLWPAQDVALVVLQRTAQATGTHGLPVTGA